MEPTSRGHTHGYEWGQWTDVDDKGEFTIYSLLGAYGQNNYLNKKYYGSTYLNQKRLNIYVFDPIIWIKNVEKILWFYLFKPKKVEHICISPINSSQTQPWVNNSPMSGSGSTTSHCVSDRKNIEMSCRATSANTEKHCIYHQCLTDSSTQQSTVSFPEATKSCW